MADKKMTKKEMYAQIKTHLTDEAEIAFIDHEVELLEKKSANKGERKPTATQKENKVIKETILDVLENGEGKTCTEIMKEIGQESNQKVSALLRQLVGGGKVTKYEVKRKSYFKLA